MRVAPQGIPKPLDVQASLPALFPQGVNSVVCSGVDALPVDIVKALGAPKIEKRLGPARQACDRILRDIKEAIESEEKRFPASTTRDVDDAEDSADHLYGWAKRIVSDKLSSSRARTKQAKLQVVPYAVALAYATRIRVITCLVKRDMASQEGDKARHLDRAGDIVDDCIALLRRALGRLMAKTSLLEITLDYQLPMALYLTLMTRFRASVDAIKSPATRPKDMAAFDDGLSPIRAVLQWKPSGAADPPQGTVIDLNSVSESLWWARFTDADLAAPDTNSLRTSIHIRELSHALGAESVDIAAKLAIKPGQQSALFQLPPASTLRTTLCANIACVYRAAPPSSFARIGAPPPQSPPPCLSCLSLPSTMQRLRSRAALRTLHGHRYSVYAVAVSALSDRVLSGSWDNTARVWSLSSGQLLRSFSGHTGPVLCVALSPDGKTAVSGSADGSVRVWSVDGSGGSQQHSLVLRGHSGRVAAVALSPDERSIVSGSSDKTVKIWNAATGQCIATLTGHSHKVSCVAISPDGETLVSGSEDRTIRVWNARTGALERTLIGHANTVLSVAVTPDGSRLVSGSADKTVRVWKLSSGEEEMKFKGHSDSVNCVAVLPDGLRIASGSWDKSIRVWNVQKRKCEITFWGHGGWVQCLAVSDDGRSLVSGSEDTTIKVWDVGKGGIDG